MGHHTHHAIIVNSWSKEHILAAHEKAKAIFRNASDITNETMNGYRSFVIPPDGSKEGWDESAEGDDRRAEFIQWLRDYAYADASSPLDWVEVQFGGDDHSANIISHRDDERKRSGNLP